MTQHGAVEPSADLRVAAKAMFEMFTAMVQEGFTEEQALAIMGAMMKGVIAGLGDPSGD